MSLSETRTPTPAPGQGVGGKRAARARTARHRRSRTKGAEGERDVVKLLAKALGDPSILRRLEQSRDGGVDVDGASLRHFACEVKRIGPASPARLREWFDGMPKDRLRIIAWRQDNADWRWTVELPLLELARLVRLVNLVRDGKHP